MYVTLNEVKPEVEEDKVEGRIGRKKLTDIFKWRYGSRDWVREGEPLERWKRRWRSTFPLETSKWNTGMSISQSQLNFATLLQFFFFLSFFFPRYIG